MHKFYNTNCVQNCDPADIRKILKKKYIKIFEDK